MEKTEIKSRVLKTEPINWHELQFIQQEKFKDLDDLSKHKLKSSLLANNFSQPFYVWEDEAVGVVYCLDGKHRVLILEELVSDGYDVPMLLPATFIICRNKKEAAKLVLIYSSIYARINQDGLFDFIKEYELQMSEFKDEIDLPDFSFPKFEDKFGFSENNSVEEVKQSLIEKFIVPPFSVLDTRQGYWQERKQRWLSLGIKSDEGRSDTKVSGNYNGCVPHYYDYKEKAERSVGYTLTNKEFEENYLPDFINKSSLSYTDTGGLLSIFDPVLCEIMYRWFCPDGGKILDPFAGGSVRGIVAGILGYAYLGIDLRLKQVLENQKQKHSIVPNSNVDWRVGNSLKLPELIGFAEKFDFIFSCPPYFDLEIYSEDKEDLSNMSFGEFSEQYGQIIKHCVDMLADNSFACFVVGEVRDRKTGFYRNLIGLTVEMFEHAGARFYNEMILINTAGSLPIRVSHQFNSSRKIGKCHQNVLIFYKGNPKEIKNKFPIMEENANFDPSNNG